MQNNPVLPIRYLVFFVALVSALIMALLFAFHLSERPATLTLPKDVGFIFPVAREIKPFALTTTHLETFNQQHLLNHWTLLFFGFTHCNSICPTTLAMLNDSYTSLHKTYPNLQVVLVSLDPERDTPAVLDRYMQSFNPHFIGITGKIQDVRKLQSQLGIFSARNEDTETSTSYQIEHTPSILLIDPKGQWAGMYRSGMRGAELTRALKDTLDFFTRQSASHQTTLL